MRRCARHREKTIIVAGDGEKKSGRFGAWLYLFGVTFLLMCWWRGGLVNKSRCTIFQDLDSLFLCRFWHLIAFLK